jgi:hypothetical protein
MFEQFLTSKVTLIKPDGKKFENIPAQVQPTQISIHDITIPIEEGDTISRDLPNGLNERYLVLDRGFHDAFQAIPARYVTSVRKESAIPARQPSSNVYNFHGGNSRVNINSNDSSVNIIQMTNEELFKQIKKIIDEKIKEDETKSLYLHQLTELEHSVGSPTFLEKYRQFIATTADHISILYPFIPALTRLITSP